VTLAGEEARMLGAAQIGTEHILLGLIGEGGGVAGRVLAVLGVSLETARQQAGEIFGRRPGASPGGPIPASPQTRNVLELALREALKLGHNYVGTEHLLLGLAREEDGEHARLLAAAGGPGPREIRRQVMFELGSYQEDPPPQGTMTGGEIWMAIERCEQMLAEIAGILGKIKKARPPL